MPDGRLPDADARQWQEANPELAEWLRIEHFANGETFLLSIQRQFLSRGWLTPRQTLTTNARRQRTEVPTRAAPATAEDVPQIFNGTYTMTDLTRGEHLTFQIYTVRHGPLQGQRIVKRLEIGVAYRGFATLGNDGSLMLWRRFQHHDGERYVEWARLLLRILQSLPDGSVGTDSFYVDETERLDGGMLVSLVPRELGVHWRVERSRFCRVCNRPLSTPTSIRIGIGPECQRRQSEDTTSAVAHERVENFNPGTRRAAVRRRAVRRPSGVVAGSDEPMLSQLGTEEVL